MEGIASFRSSFYVFLLRKYFLYLLSVVVLPCCHSGNRPVDRREPLVNPTFFRSSDLETEKYEKM